MVLPVLVAAGICHTNLADSCDGVGISLMCVHQTTEQLHYGTRVACHNGFYFCHCDDYGHDGIQK